MAEFYALIENDEIKKLNVPRGFSLKHVSFSVNSPDEDYAAHGYYPIVGEQPEYDHEMQTCSQPEYTWNPAEGRVDKTFVVTDISLADMRVKIQNQIKADCTARILAAYPEPIQRSAGLGIYTTAVINAMTVFIAGCIEEENRCFDELEAATTLAEVEAVTPTFPEA